MLNKSDLAKEVGVRVETIQIKLVRPYYENIGKQFVKSPKLYINDTGIVSYFLGINSLEILEVSHHKGALVETFVCNELLKHISFASDSTSLFHYRTSDKKEIDFILQQNNKIIAIEVKSSSKVEASDFKHIIDFQKNGSGDIFGVVFYMGENVPWINERCVALPFSFLLGGA
jgi:hypothetical protein